MALRSIANASIAFGLVNIPVRIHAATEASESISFNLLHADCGARLKQRYECPQHECVVERDEAVKGYEFQKGCYVTFTPSECKALEAESDSTIAITEFVDEALPLLTFVDRCYFLGPDKGGDRAYRLLVAALVETGRAAIARYAARGKMHLVMLTVSEQRLLMVQLHYADEVRSIRDVPLEPTELTEDELALAKLLTSKLRGAPKRRAAFDLSRYRDEVKDRMRSQIDAKIAGREIVATPPAKGPAPILDLVQALKASIAARPARRAARAVR